jgi:hypothetical protein
MLKLILLGAAALYFVLSLFFVLYVAAMNFARVKDKYPERISFWVKFFAYPWVYGGSALNALVNLFFLSILFLGLPRRFGEPCTERFTRHHDEDNFRGKLSRGFAHDLIDIFDSEHDGVHIPGDGHE